MYGKRLSGVIPAAMYGSSAPRIQYASSHRVDSYVPRKRSRLNDGSSATGSSSGSQAYSSRSRSPASIDRYVPTSHPTDNIHYQAPSATSREIERLRNEENNPQSKIFRKVDFKPGMIIRCALHESDYKGASSNSGTNFKRKFQSESSFGPVFTKVRIMIVVACYESSYIALPLYTHNGNGLSHKSPSQQLEYVSVRDHRLEGPFTALSSQGILQTEYLKDGIYMIDPASTVHLTYHHSRSYNLPIVHQGHLTKQSTNLLIELYNEFAPEISRF